MGPGHQYFLKDPRGILVRSEGGEPHWYGPVCLDHFHCSPSPAWLQVQLPNTLPFIRSASAQKLSGIVCSEQNPSWHLSSPGTSSRFHTCPASHYLSLSMASLPPPNCLNSCLLKPNKPHSTLSAYQKFCDWLKWGSS